jgi:Skp family chaperone for outer membrane proteins
MFIRLLSVVAVLLLVVGLALCQPPGQPKPMPEPPATTGDVDRLRQDVLDQLKGISKKLDDSEKLNEKRFTELRDELQAMRKEFGADIQKLKKDLEKIKGDIRILQADVKDLQNERGRQQFTAAPSSNSK